MRACVRAYVCEVVRKTGCVVFVLCEKKLTRKTRGLVYIFEFERLKKTASRGVVCITDKTNCDGVCLCIEKGSCMKAC